MGSFVFKTFLAALAPVIQGWPDMDPHQLESWLEVVHAEEQLEHDLAEVTGEGSSKDGVAARGGVLGRLSTSAGGLEEEEGAGDGDESAPLILCPVLAAMAKAEWKKSVQQEAQKSSFLFETKQWAKGAGILSEKDDHYILEPHVDDETSAVYRQKMEHNNKCEGMAKDACKKQYIFKKDKTHFWVEQEKLKSGLKDIGVRKIFAWFQGSGVAAYEVNHNGTRSARSRSWSGWSDRYLNIRKLLNNPDVEHGFSTGVRGRANVNNCITAALNHGGLTVYRDEANEQLHEQFLKPAADDAKTWRSGICCKDKSNKAYFWDYDEADEADQREELDVTYKSGIKCPKGEHGKEIYPCLALFLYFWSRNANKEKDSAFHECGVTKEDLKQNLNRNAVVFDKEAFKAKVTGEQARGNMSAQLEEFTTSSGESENSKTAPAAAPAVSKEPDAQKSQGSTQAPLEAAVPLNDDGLQGVAVLHLCHPNEKMDTWRFYREDIRRVVCAAKDEGDRGGEFSKSESKIAETWQMKLATMGWLDGFGRQDESDSKKLYLTHKDVYQFLMEGKFPDDLEGLNYKRRSWGGVLGSMRHVTSGSCKDFEK